ncbi:putative polysaccharide biosynthesis protein [Oceanirhabdus sp. W0125-5]|uniref:putative polysaccharide biosynthesis protein n=1 Tax=Oceanirhabdus sp. W0125-5 TaxID=2999116 RepID=UPI0022F3019E|nr:polysaccharide biosynthesis protein [Oceanirhabdus sp. W0125-5]WBW96033.1 polysaccharide biosynthesis protein [Oceanirhabdus sp. W0125-5]
MDNRGSIKKQSIVGGFAILSIAGILSKLLSVVYQPLLNGIIEKDGMGLYGATYGIFVYFYMIANSGLPNSISKLVSEEIELGNENRAHRIFLLSRKLLIIFGGLLSIIMFFGSNVFAEWMGYPKISLAVKVLSPAVFITAVLSSYKGYFQGQKYMTPTGISQIFEQFANVFISLTVAALLLNSKGLIFGVAGATTGTVVGALLAILIMIIYYRRSKLDEIKTDNTEDKILIKKIIAQAAPITFCMSLQGLGLILDPKILEMRLSSIGFTEKAIEVSNGFIFRYNSLINVPIALAMALAVAVLPSVAALMAKGYKERLKNRIDFSIKLCFIVTIPCAVGLSVLAYPICKLLKYNSSGVAELLIYGSGILLLMSIIQIQTAIMQGINKLYTITVISVSALVLKLAINYFTIVQFDYIGVLIGNGMGYLLIVILSTISINKTIDGKVKIISSAVKPLISAGIMGAVVFGINKLLYMVFSMVLGNYISNALAVVISIIIGAVTYGGVFLIIGGLSKDEFDAMPNKIKRLVPKRFL